MPIRVLLSCVLVVSALAPVVQAQTKTPAPALVVLNKDDSQLAIFDPQTFQVVARVPTGPIPHEVAVSSDGKLAVSTNYGEHQNGTTLSVIDLDAQKEIHRFELPDLIGPHGIEFFKGKFWFTAEGSKKIAHYDPATNKVDWTHEIGQDRTHMLVIARDGRTIYTSNVSSNSVTAVEANFDKSQWTNTVIPVGKGPEGIDISPDGREVWAANSGDGTVSVIDTATKKVIASFNVGTKHSNRVKFTPHGKFALISDLGSGDLVVIDVAARKESKRLHLGKSSEGILIVPDGSKAFVAVSGDNKVAVIDLKNFAVITTFETGKDPDGMAWRQ
jgi:YVTN family beta-propeller protein